MRYWDTSALLPLCVREPSSALLTRTFTEDSGVITWWGTRLEATSALARLERDGALAGAGQRAASARLGALAAAWAEVEPGVVVREQAERLLRIHPLRAADALQLAAAIVASGHRPPTLPLVSLDQRLSEAARREGFPLVIPTTT